MPGRKKRICNIRKPSLMFLESPLDGDRHTYGIPAQSALNPKHVPTLPVDQNSSALGWVKSQFESGEQLQFPPRRQKQYHTESTSSYGTSFSISRISKTKKSSVCKFPALSFNEASEVPQRQKCAPRAGKPILRNKGLLTCKVTEDESLPPLSRNTSVFQKAGQGAKKLATNEAKEYTTNNDGQLREPENSTRFGDLSTNDASTPPTVYTPVANLCSSVGEHHKHSPVMDLRFLNYIAQTPCAVDHNDILVQDTPEKEYGLKVTWRRRKTVMKYLKDRGKLTRSEILVNADMK
ncbi:RAD9, HUS1, RAD1-interacting nuclear orphan protein 1 [Erpetoichthys calabaricus]|uniref:RAD9, HUS1, RAD1-interacting nuclear orphan protein 1 n=1 Tax=Erpetoichthys calabaricus TaxID=27687 RepID=A0A8C4X572_ERPCA|nr:RAD9, HUS1, RAD1-interacting nuclear orphan protein 1 [Erpetoichthys calabaricus]